MEKCKDVAGGYAIVGKLVVMVGILYKRDTYMLMLREKRKTGVEVKCVQRKRMSDRINSTWGGGLA